MMKTLADHKETQDYDTNTQLNPNERHEQAARKTVD